MNSLCINIHNNFSYDNSFLERLDLKEKNEISFIYISDFRSAKVLRSFISDLSDKLGIDKIWKSRLILITDELNNNAIEYGSSEGENNKLTVMFSIKNNSIDLFVEVEDTGNGKAHKTSKQMILFRNKKKLNGFFKNNGIRGRGLFMIIEKLVDKLYFKDGEKGGLIVGINKKLEIKKD